MTSEELNKLKHKAVEAELDYHKGLEKELNSLKTKVIELEKDVKELQNDDSDNGTIEPPPPPEPQRLKAFPSATGAGADATGGRGGIVVHVTNLNSSGVGSLANALLMTVPRVIVIDVSGVCQIPKLLYLTSANSNFTLAGQTAPEGGLTVDGGRVYFNDVDNIIVRHVRFKGGIDADWIPNNGDGKGSASITAAGNVRKQIWDHVSFGFGKTMPAWNPQGDDLVNEVTIQNCLFSETEKGAIIGKSVEHPTGLRNFTFRNNVFYNCDWRFPNVGGNSEEGTSIDVVNNLTWTSSGRLIRGAGNLNLNHINNVYYVGSYSLLRDTGVNLWSDDGGKWNPKIYTKGNLIDAPNVASDIRYSLSEMNSDNKKSWNYFAGSRYGDPVPSSFFTDTPHGLKGEPYDIIEASELKDYLINTVGCNARLNADGSVSANYDVEDASYLKNISEGVYTRGLQTIQYNVTPIVSVERPNDFYQSNEHIPQAYLDRRGIVGNAEVHNKVMESGYTLIEEYINEVD